MLTTNQPLSTSSCSMHASDWNTWRIVLSPTIISLRPFMQWEKWEALKSCSSHP